MYKDTLDSENLQSDKSLPVAHLISYTQFIILSISTFSLYNLWWMNKAWWFFKKIDIEENYEPDWRTLLSPFYMVALFDKIQEYADENGNEKRYNSNLVFMGIVAMNLSMRFGLPIGFINFFSCFLYFKPFNMLNTAKENSGKFNCIHAKSFNVRQIFLILIGLVLWFFLIKWLIEAELHPEL